MNFSEEFNDAIELKVKAKQEALQARNEKERTITFAEAEQVRIKTIAEATAFKTLKEASARADAIELEANALRNNPELIKLRLIEKWNGVMPRFTGGKVMPMLDVTDVFDGSQDDFTSEF